ncbi:MAG: hypothetical protein A2142_03560 [candidate division Zixibacteria bacterium RBG_16_48_11]|nr:MAG: hypothetical protein A2142_03560 [candidate division Zixibacteria bacterium RBG_16_48_11]
MKRNGIVLAVLFLLPVIIFVPKNGKALYFFAAKEGTRCSTCHLNPTGGMLRTQVGLDYAQNDHSFQEADTARPLLSFFMGENLQAGSDVRLLYNYRDTTDFSDPTAQNQSTFLTMQGALYLSANLGEHLTLFYNNDFGYGGFGQNRELWGLFKKLPYNAYVKVGRFKIPYGMKLDDHTSFVKDRLGFGTQSREDGVEIGLTPATFFAHLSVTNGEENLPIDYNTYKAVTATSGFIIRHFSLGASFYYNRTSFSSLEKKRAGAFGSISCGNLVLLGEVDYGWQDSLPGASEPEAEVLAAFAEAGFRPHPKVWLKSKFDYYDPQRGMQDDDLQRITLEGDLYILKFSELRLLYRINQEEPEKNNNEVLALLHIFF